MQSESQTNRAKLLLWIALILIIVGGLLANLVQTQWGKVDVRNVHFTGTNGVMMSAFLYIPDGVTNKNPAPGVLCVHGYFNSKEQQASFAIELSRRGYVVLALDQTGHGYSDPAVYTNAFGGPDGLAYLRSLDIVDKNNIGMEGHSMGGWAILNAAKVYPDGYKSMVLEGSGTGGIGNLVYGVPAGNVTWPRNLCVVLSKWDEFANVMWGSFNPAAPDQGNMNIPSNIGNSNAMKATFGTTEKVVEGKLYGSIANGTARILKQPAVIHPADMEDAAAVGDAVDWFQKTLTGATQIPVSSQVWIWKEIGTLIAMIGMILLLFPVGSLLLANVGFFKELQREPAASAPKAAKGLTWWVSAVLFAAIPAITYFHFTSYTTTWKFNPSRLFPQPMTNQLMLWVLLLGAVTLVLFLLWHFAFNRKAQASAADYGLSWGTGFMGVGWMKILKSFLLAVTVAFIAYLTLAISVWIFGTDFRFWVVTFKPMTALQFRVFLSYLIPFMMFFIVLSLALHGQVRPGGKDGKDISQPREMLINFGMMVIGFLVLLAIQYIPFITGGTLTWTGPTLTTALIFQLIPVFTIVALVLTYFYRKTGHIYAGAFLIAILVTWSLTAGQAIGFNIMP